MISSLQGTYTLPFPTAFVITASLDLDLSFRIAISLSRSMHVLVYRDHYFPSRSLLLFIYCLNIYLPSISLSLSRVDRAIHVRVNEVVLYGAVSICQFHFYIAKQFSNTNIDYLITSVISFFQLSFYISSSEQQWDKNKPKLK